jgi:2-dehydro-3-deoxyphosphooctonate aldolase (KDO 8-P synthase)
VCFDVTHSTQLPGIGGGGGQSGGRPERAPLLARAAAAAGVHALFLEVHPDPARAVSDGATQLRIESALDVLEQVAGIGKRIESRE